MTETRDLGEQLDHLRHVHSAMARNATTETMLEVSWCLLDYMLWTMDYKPAPADPYRPITSPEARAAMRDVVASNPMFKTGVEALIDDLERAEAVIKGAGL